MSARPRFLQGWGYARWRTIELLLERGRAGDAEAWNRAVQLMIQRDQANTAIDHALQWAILPLSILGALLLSDPGSSAMRWGYVLCLAAQPFWLISTARKGQFGMFFMAMFYTGVWVRGVAISF